MIYTPAPWNQTVIDHQLDVKRGGSWAGMGTGKTGATLTALQAVQDAEDPRPYLVLAPKRVASRTWPREALKWDHIDSDTAVLVGSAQDRIAALRRHLRTGNDARATVNYENIPWLIETLADLKVPWPWPTVVADESTRLKSYRRKQGGQRAQLLHGVAFEYVERFIELTGTPSPNGLLDLWGQMAFVDNGQRLGASYTAYRNRWFYPPPSGNTLANWLPHDHSTEQIHARLRDVCCSVSVPVDKPIVNKVYVELPARVRDMYKRMEKDAYIEIRDRGFEAVHAAAKSNKLMQICSGAIYDENHVAEYLHTAKVEALESVIAEAAGMPVLVAVNFQFDWTIIKRAFPQARKIDTDRDIDDFAAGKIGLGVAHPGSLGHGINDMERGTNIGVFWSGDWNLEMHDQIIERIGPMRQKQSGFDRPTYLHYLLVENSIDEAVFERRVEKATVQDALMHAMKRIGL